MKSKGLYVSTIALVGVAIISAIAFSTVSAVETQMQKSDAGKIIELKWDMQNARYLVGKSIADAIADGSCGPGGTGTINTDKVQGYAEDVLQESISNCTVKATPESIVVRTATVNATISCQKSTGSLSLKYEKQFEIEKIVWVSAAPNCLVDVEDKPSEECEVDTILGSEDSGIGCGN